jgi:hypothetical protein
MLYLMGMGISVGTVQNVGWHSATRNPRGVHGLRNDVILKKTIKDDVGVMTVEGLLAHQSWQNLTAAATTAWSVRRWTWQGVVVRRVINGQDDLQQNA